MVVASLFSVAASDILRERERERERDDDDDDDDDDGFRYCVTQLKESHVTSRMNRFSSSSFQSRWFVFKMTVIGSSTG